MTCRDLDTELRRERSSRGRNRDQINIGLASMEAAFWRLILVRLDTNMMIHGTSEPLLAAQVLFGCLYAEMDQQELNLFQLATRFVT